METVATTEYRWHIICPEASDKRAVSLGLSINSSIGLFIRTQFRIETVPATCEVLLNSDFELQYIRNHIAPSAAYDSVFSFFITFTSFTLGGGGRLSVRDGVGCLVWGGPASLQGSIPPRAVSLAHIYCVGCCTFSLLSGRETKVNY